MSNYGKFFDGGLRILRQFNNPRQAGIGGHHAPEKIAKDLFDLAIDQIINFEFVEAVGSLELP